MLFVGAFYVSPRHVHTALEYKPLKNRLVPTLDEHMRGRECFSLRKLAQSINPLSVSD